MLSQSRDHAPIKNAPRSSWLTPPLTPEALRWRPWTPEDLEEIFGCLVVVPPSATRWAIEDRRHRRRRRCRRRRRRRRRRRHHHHHIKMRGMDKLHKTINIYLKLPSTGSLSSCELLGVWIAQSRLGPTLLADVHRLSEKSWNNRDRIQNDKYSQLYPKWLGNLATKNFPVESPGFLMFPWQHHLAHQSIP